MVVPGPRAALPHALLLVKAQLVLVLAVLVLERRLFVAETHFARFFAVQTVRLAFVALDAAFAAREAPCASSAARHFLGVVDVCEADRVLVVEHGGHRGALCHARLRDQEPHLLLAIRHLRGCRDLLVHGLSKLGRSVRLVDHVDGVLLLVGGVLRGVDVGGVLVLLGQRVELVGRGVLRLRLRLVLRLVLWMRLWLVLGVMWLSLWLVWLVLLNVLWGSLRRRHLCGWGHRRPLQLLHGNRLRRERRPLLSHHRRRRRHRPRARGIDPRKHRCRERVVT